MMISDSKATIIREIDKNVVREGLKDGVYSSATFYFGKNKFKVFADYEEDGVRVGSLILKNGKPYRGSIVSNGRYRSISLYGGANLMEHQLLVVALVPNAVDLLFDDNENNVINHKTIYKASLDFKERRKLFDEQLEYYNWSGVEPDYTLLQNPFIPPCDVRDLEICTSAENNAHGALINTFELYDVSISAKDVPLLKQYLINEEQVKYTIEMYTKHGAEVMTDMLKG